MAAHWGPAAEPSSAPARWAGLALIVALHLGGLWALLQVPSVREAVVSLAPVMVTFVAPPPEPVVPEKPVVTPPRQQQPVKPKPKPQVIATAAATASPIQAPPLPEATPPPEPPPAAVAPAPPAPPAPIIPPNFAAAYLDNPRPVYPPVSKKLGETGSILLRVLVNAGGRPEQVELQQGSGFPRLDEAAMDAVRRWRFVPAHQGDAVLSAWVLVPVVFDLKR